MTRLTPSWMMLVEAFRLSFKSQCLGFALVGLVISTAAWHVTGILCLRGPPEFAKEYHAAVAQWPVQAEPRYGIVGYLPERLQQQIPSRALVPLDAVVAVPRRIVEPFLRVFLGGLPWRLCVYYLTGGLISLFVWSYCGTVISRTAVTGCGLRQPAHARSAIHFARRRGYVVLVAVALPMVGIVLLAMPFALSGILVRLDVGVLLAGVLWGFVLPAGLLMAILSLGILVGWPLMWGAVAAEGSDAFDVISRTYAYSFQRPFQYLCYASVAAALAIAGWGLAWWLTEAVIHFSYWAIGLGCGPERLKALLAAVNGSLPEEASGMMSVGVVLLRVHVALTRCLASAHAYSFFWCAASAVYLLLRYDTDETEPDEIHMDDANPEQEGTDAD